MTKQKAAPTAHGPDNNKRLALLEAGVSSLAIVLAANDAALAEGVDPFEAAIGQIKAAAEVKAEIRKLADYLLAEHGDAISEGSAVDVAIKLLTDLKDNAGASFARADTAEKHELELEQQVAALKAEIVELTTDVEEITSAKNALANQLAEAGQAPASADAPAEPPAEEAPTASRERPEAARDVGPEYGTFALADLVKLKETDVDATFELAFSNGQFEILGIDPIAIAASCLVETEGSLKVNVPIQVRGRGAIEDVAGAGLLLGGEQVGYCVFDPAVKLHPGEERRFDHSLLFG